MVDPVDKENTYINWIKTFITMFDRIDIMWLIHSINNIVISGPPYLPLSS